jgi:dihydrolipoamide dehydrogenase
MESRKFLEVTTLPDSLLVLGGGVIGCEFACMAAQLGVKVTIIEMLEDILTVLDKDVRREIRKKMEGELGITILTGSPMTHITADESVVSGRVDGEMIQGGMLLASTGRKAHTNGLNLGNAGITLTESGHIEIDTCCRTQAETVYAVGDVTAGSTQLAHAATSEGITAADNACTGGRSPKETIMPACIFTAPEAGSVGLTERDAAEQGINVKVGKFMFSGLGKAIAVGETGGFVKWLVDPESGRFLGAHAVGEHATELIAEAATAIRAGLTAEQLGKTVHCHPTFSEAWMEAAHAVHGECIHQPAKRRML